MKKQITNIVYESVRQTLKDMKMHLAEGDTRILDVKEKAKAALKNVKKFGYNIKLRVERNADGYIGVYATLRNGLSDVDDVFDKSSRISKLCQSMKENGFVLETAWMEDEYRWLFDDELYNETDRKRNDRIDNNKSYDDGAEYYQWNDRDRRGEFMNKQFKNDRKIAIAESDITKMVYEAARRILKEYRLREHSKLKGRIVIDLDDVLGKIGLNYPDELFDYFDMNKRANDFDDVYYYINATFELDRDDPEVGYKGDGWVLDEDEGIDDLIRMIQRCPDLGNEDKAKFIQGVESAYDKAINDGNWNIEEPDDPYDRDMRDHYLDR